MFKLLASGLAKMHIAIFKVVIEKALTFNVNAFRKTLDDPSLSAPLLFGNDIMSSFIYSFIFDSLCASSLTDKHVR